MQAADRLIDKPNYAFLREHVHKVKGWLNDYAAIRTMEFLDWQESQGMSGPVLEIGVFSGRYFSILLRSAVRTGSRAVGVDTFQWLPLDTVRTALAPIEGGEAAVFLSQPSTYLSGADLLAALGAKPRFFSIDGSHESDDVVWDLRLGEDILAPEGLISVDDFLNPMTLGVNEGVHRFFGQPRNLAPVAYAANKLFLARPFFADQYRKVFEASVVADEIEGRSEDFRKRLASGREKVEGRLWGHPLLFVP
jgi:hypothetical protein